jgi:hypothetical protein
MKQSFQILAHIFCESVYFYKFSPLIINYHYFRDILCTEDIESLLALFSLLLQNNTTIVSRLTPIRIKNNFLLASASPFTFRTTPISNSTIPNTVLPTLMDSVASIYNSFVLPPVKVMTSFDENM